jgi:hypothetical protein
MVIVKLSSRYVFGILLVILDLYLLNGKRRLVTIFIRWNYFIKDVNLCGVQRRLLLRKLCDTYNVGYREQASILETVPTYQIILQLHLDNSVEETVPSCEFTYHCSMDL